MFPAAGRDVAPIVGDSYSTEDARDRIGEAEEVMRLAGVTRGMSVADVGAGEGYYTVRLAPLVGPRGRVLAEDIVPETRDRLAQRVERENLDNVAVRLGQPANPLLPPGSFDRIFLVHVYHEVTEPYEFLWHLRAGLKAGRAGDRGRRRSAGETPWNAAARTGVRSRGARITAGADPASRRQRRLLYGLQGSLLPGPAPAIDQALPCERLKQAHPPHAAQSRSAKIR